MRTLTLYALLLAFGLLRPIAALAGESSFEAGIGFGGEYNDNVGETAHNKKTDFITHIKPTLSFSHQGGRITLTGTYRGDYQFYTQGNAQDDYMHYLNLSLSAEVVENLFFIDVMEDLQPVYTNPARGDVIEGDTMMDMVNRNTFVVSPYFRLHFSDRTDARFGYRFTDLRYSEGKGRHTFIPGLDGEYDFNSRVSLQHALFAEINHALTDRLSLTAGMDVIRYDVEKTRPGEDDQSLTRYRAYAGGTWEAAEDVVVKVQGGPSYSVRDKGDSKMQPYLNSSVTWQVGNSEFGLSYDIDYYDDPRTGGNNQRTSYGGWWRKSFDRSELRLGLAYNSYDRDDSTDEYLRPSFSYRYDLTERLKATVSGTAELSQGSSQYGDTYYANAGLQYELDEKSWIGITYRRKTVDSASNGRAYDINRVMLEVYFAF